VRAEDALQKQVCQYLDKALPLASWYCAIPNGAVLSGDGKARGMQMNRLKATGLKPGAPDLIIIWNGSLLCLELKTATGKLNDNQAKVSDHLVNAGAHYTVARSIDEIEAWLLLLDMPLRSRLLQLRRAA
jgi:hypothetical protein